MAKLRQRLTRLAVSATPADVAMSTTMRDMSMGKRERERQPAMWVTTTEVPTAASHPFYRRLNQLLREQGFDDFVEAQCAEFYAETMGRPGLPPGSTSACC
jgi:hypothetical protein